MKQLLTSRTIGLLLTLVMLKTTHAQNVPRELSLQEAIALAHTNSTVMQIDSINELAAREALQQSRQALLPSLSLNASYLRLSDNVTPFRAAFPEGQVTLNPQILNQSYNAVELRQLVFAGGRPRHDIRQNSLNLEMAQHQREQSAREVIYQVIDLWYSIYSLNQTIRALDQSIAVLKSRRQEMANLANAGLALHNDVLKVDIALTNLASEQADLASQRNTLQYTLSILAGLDATQPFELPAALPNIAVLDQSKEEWLSQALNNRPDVKSALLARQKATLARGSAQAEYLPTVSVGGTVNHDRPNQRIFPNRAEFDATWTAGVFLTWNLSALYTNGARMAQARLGEAQADKIARQVQDGVRVEVFQAIEKYEVAKMKVADSEKLVAQAVENFQVEENRLNQQVISVTDYLVANEQLIQAQVTLIRAQINRDLAYQQLLKATHN